jgi:aminoglycoside phosphotransferase (APT) family kinase protein
MPNLGLESKHTSGWLEIGDLAILLDADARLRLLRDSGVPAIATAATYIRLKPGTGALVGLDLRLDTPDGEITLAGYIRTHEAARAAELASKWHPGRAVATPVGDGVRLLAGGRSVLFLFPNDARVEGMRFVADVDKLKRVLARIESIRGDGWRVRGRKTVLQTIRYKPERRLILRAHLAQKNDRTGENREMDVFIRFFVDDRGENIARFRRALEEQPIGRYLPRLLGVWQDGRLFVEAAVDGGELLPHVLAGTADAEAVAQMLTHLHRATVDGLPEIHSDAVLETARESAGNLMRVAPVFADLLHEILDRLQDLLPASPAAATLHGDCHLHQFLQGPDGPVLVDFERVARGDARFDLGHLCAHLMILERKEPDAAPAIRSFTESLLEHYTARNPDTAMDGLPFFIGCGLLERALLPFRRVQNDWPARCRELLALTRETIDAKPRPRDAEPWAVVQPRSSGPWPGWTWVGETRSFGKFEPSLRSFVTVDPAADSKLPGLAPWIARGELVSYRFGRRATVAIPGGRFVKIVRPSNATALAERLAGLERLDLRSRPLMPAFPRLLESNLEEGVFVFARVDGESVHDRSERGIADLETVAAGLVAFHSIEVLAADDLPAAHAHGSLRTWSDHVALVDPALHARCEATRHRLESRDRVSDGTVDRQDRLVHGDLHDKNLLVHEHALGILDLDQLGVGNPADDLGNFAAHYVLRAMQAGDTAAVGRARARQFLRVYASHGGGIHAQSIMAVGADTLFRLACLYRFRKRWRDLSAGLLAEAGHWTEGDL